jgi:hypothetical protein
MENTQPQINGYMPNIQIHERIYMTGGRLEAMKE